MLQIQIAQLPAHSMTTRAQVDTWVMDFLHEANMDCLLDDVPWVVK